MMAIKFLKWDSVNIPKSVTSIGAQSSWNPDVIYGVKGSEAERFADQNGYIFEAEGGSDDPVIEDPPPGGGPGGNGGSNEGDNGGGNEGDNGGSGGSNNGSNGGGTTTKGGSTTTVARSTGSSASRNIGTAQVGSGTPKTGIDFDARYVLCAGVFLAGICLVLTKKKKNMNA